eukprot:tig00001098_g7064.t1
MPIARITQELIEEILQRTKRDYADLHALNLSNNEIEVIENLGRLTRLARLNLSNNRIERIDGLETLGALVELNLSKNRISRLDGLEAARALELLDLSQNRVADVAELDLVARLPALRHLTLAGNPVCSLREYRVEALRRMPALQSLDGAEVSAEERAYVRVLAADAGSPPPPPPSRPPTPRSPIPPRPPGVPLRPRPLRAPAAPPHRRRVQVGVAAGAAAAGAAGGVPPTREGRLEALLALERDRSADASAQLRLARAEAERLQGELQEREAAFQERADALARPSPPRPAVAGGAEGRAGRRGAGGGAAPAPPGPPRPADVLEEENEALRSQLDLLKVQAESLQNVMAILEAEMAAAKGRGPGARRALEERVAGRWREKVFQLLVREKQERLRRDDERRRFDDEIAARDEAVRELETEIRVLREKGEAARAAAQAEAAALQAARAAAARAEAREKELAARWREQAMQTSRLAETVHALHGQILHFDAAMQAGERRVAGLSQRVAFAAGRLPVLSAMLEARDRQWRGRAHALQDQLRAVLDRRRAEGGDTASSSGLGTDRSYLEQPPRTSWRALLDGPSDAATLRRELELMAEERDALARLARQAADDEARRVATARGERAPAPPAARASPALRATGRRGGRGGGGAGLRERLAEAERELSDTRAALHAEREARPAPPRPARPAEGGGQRTAALDVRLSRTAEEAAERDREARALRREADEARRASSRATSEEVERAEAEAARLQRELAASRRDLAKTQAALKALERQVARERLRTTREDRARLEELERQLEAKEAQLHAARRERNALLSAARKQELGALGSPGPAPRRASSGPRSRSASPQRGGARGGARGRGGPGAIPERWARLLDPEGYEERRREEERGRSGRGRGGSRARGRRRGGGGSAGSSDSSSGEEALVAQAGLLRAAPAPPAGPRPRALLARGRALAARGLAARAPRADQGYASRLSEATRVALGERFR